VGHPAAKGRQGCGASGLGCFFGWSRQLVVGTPEAQEALVNGGAREDLKIKAGGPALNAKNRRLV